MNCDASRYSSTPSATSLAACLTSAKKENASSTTGATSESACMSCESGTYSNLASAS